MAVGGGYGEKAKNQLDCSILFRFLFMRGFLWEKAN